MEDLPDSAKANKGRSHMMGTTYLEPRAEAVFKLSDITRRSAEIWSTGMWDNPYRLLHSAKSGETYDALTFVSPP